MAVSASPGARPRVQGTPGLTEVISGASGAPELDADRRREEEAGANPRRLGVTISERVDRLLESRAEDLGGGGALQGQQLLFEGG